MSQASEIEAIQLSILRSSIAGWYRNTSNVLDPSQVVAVCLNFVLLVRVHFGISGCQYTTGSGIIAMGIEGHDVVLKLAKHQERVAEVLR